MFVGLGKQFKKAEMVIGPRPFIWIASGDMKDGALWDTVRLGAWLAPGNGEEW